MPPSHFMGKRERTRIIGSLRWRRRAALTVVSRSSRHGWDRKGVLRKGGETIVVEVGVSQEYEYEYPTLKT